jgi:uncharacterized damage-inducible protein DinB
MSAHDVELAAILARIDAARQSFAQSLAALSDAQRAALRFDDGSTLKDLLAHLAFWDQRFLHAVQPEPPDAFRLVPPAIADIPYNEDMHWADQVNARIRDLYAQRTLASVKGEFEQTSSRMDAFLRNVTPHDVFDPDGLSAAIGMPFDGFMRGIYEHYEAHLGDIQRRQ